MTRIAFPFDEFDIKCQSPDIRNWVLTCIKKVDSGEMMNSYFYDALQQRATNGHVMLIQNIKDGYEGRRPSQEILNQEEERFARIFKHGDDLMQKGQIHQENWEDAKNRYLRKELSLDQLDAYLKRISPNKNSLFSGAVSDANAAISADDKSNGTGIGQFAKPKRSIFSPSD